MPPIVTNFIYGLYCKLDSRFINVKIKVLDATISCYQLNKENYISLTDMVKNNENGLSLIEKWLRNKNTIEFIGIWEEIYNPGFNSPEFEGIKNQAGKNRFVLETGLIDGIPISNILIEIKRKNC